MVLALTLLKTYIFKGYCSIQVTQPRRNKQTMTTKFKFLFASLVLAGITTVSAQTVGYVSFNFPAGSVAAPKVSAFSLPLRDSVASGFVGSTSGGITGVTSNTLTSTGAGWTASSLNLAASPYFVRIKNGTNTAGYTFLITGNTTEVLTVSTPVDLTTLGLVTTAGSTQSTFEIFPGDTILSLFGNGTADGSNNTTMGGSSATNADVVRVHDGNGFKEYYFNLANNRWQEGGFNRNTVVIYPHMGITYMRRATTALDVVISGVVPDTNLKAYIKNSGASYVSYPFPVDVTLGNSGIQSMPGWVKADTATAADNLLIWDGNGWKTYYYHQTNNRWQEGGFNRTTTVIPAGRPLWIVKKGVASGTTLWDFTIPYALN